MINRSHWQYFLALEQEIIKLSHFVSIDRRNFATFSLEILKIYLSVCSEVDVVARLLSKKIDPDNYQEKTKNDKENKNIKTYREMLFSKYPEISDVTITIEPELFSVVPWASFKEEKSPEWWHRYNKVKHTRDEFFHHANLQNTLEAVSGLLVLLNYFCHPMNHDIACIVLEESTTPKLLKINGNHFLDGSTWDGPRIYLPNQEILNK